MHRGWKYAEAGWLADCGFFKEPGTLQEGIDSFHNRLCRSDSWFLQPSVYVPRLFVCL